MPDLETMIEIAVLGRPVAKGRPRFNRESGRAYTPAKTASFEAELKFAAMQAMRGRAPLEGPLVVDMFLVVPIAKSWSKKKQEAARCGDILPTGKPDWDNYGKCVDSLNLVVWGDDGQVVDGRVRKRYGDKPGTWIRVSHFSPDMWPDPWPHETEEGIFG